MADLSRHLEILSDDDEDPSSPPFKIPFRTLDRPESTAVVILDDDPTPKKPSPAISTPSIVPETPMSPPPRMGFDSDVLIIKCTARISGSDPKSSGSGSGGLILLESDNESEGGREGKDSKENEKLGTGFGRNSGASPSFREYPSFLGSEFGTYTDDLTCSVGDRFKHGECSVDVTREFDWEANAVLEQVANARELKEKGSEADEGKQNRKDEVMARKRKTKEEKIQLAEEKKLKREQEKLRKQALKAEALEMKKLQKEQQKWEKGNFALKSIVAEIDAKVVELGSIGGHLLSRFAEKGLNFRITSNPIERSIIWKMPVPEQLSKLSKGAEVSYLLLVYEAEEFCDLILSKSLMDHISRTQHRYPSYTICYLTNKLMAYINKREQAQYKNPLNNSHWRRPPVEEALAKLSTDFVKVHTRQCRDEAEIADHVVGLTYSLASCQFRKKLTRLSINANGSHVPKDFIDKNLIKKSIWLKVLVAIPKVQPRFAVAIWKKYPTMKSLLSVYMDPNKSVHEKEFLLKDLPTEGLLGQEDRRVGEICSKRVYRILMAQNGNIRTDDVEDGADFFRH
ncbi:hypothetical protein Scep_018694 [Stephania cephalantha]|uniref:ERCC4 domain-containing protein n=1 Tax=Stephania cephalantha TaxID=152367 RepID=A0AAP0NMG3_9MAGN